MKAKITHLLALIRYIEYTLSKSVVMLCPLSQLCHMLVKWLTVAVFRPSHLNYEGD